MAQALRGAGYDSTSLVYEGDRLVSADRFDIVFRPLPGSNIIARHINAYLCFTYVLFRFDVAVFWFNGGFLLDTPWQLPEMRLLGLAGMATIMMPYGSDVAVPAYLGPARAASLATDPSLSSRTAAIIRRVDYFCRHCDFIIRNVTPGYIPRCDAFIFNFLAIDTNSAGAPDQLRDQRTGDEVVVVHATNHRLLKGTNELIAAIAELRMEGVPIRLDLIEAASNRVVRAALAECDIVADQFLFGYGMFGIEGMAAGKPLLTRLGWMLPEVIAATCLHECPAIDTDVTTIKDNLRMLARDPALRCRLGKASLAYVLKYHSYDAAGRNFGAVVEHVWNGSPLPENLRPVRTNESFDLHYALEESCESAHAKRSLGALS